MASRVFAVGGNFVGSTLTGTDRPGDIHASRSYVKPTGNPADSSDYTNYRGAMAIQSDKAAVRGRMLQNNDPTRCNTPALPAPYFNGCGVNNGGMRQSNTVSLSGSDFVRQQIAAQVSRNPIPHNRPGSKPAGPVAVNDNLWVNGYTNCANGGSNGGSNYRSILANHSIKDIRAPQPSYNPNPPSQANGAFARMGMPVTQQNAYKAGAALPRRIPNFNLGGTKHHGNDLFVNQKQNIVTYKGPPGAKPHLRLNQPMQGNVKPSDTQNGGEAGGEAGGGGGPQ
jgi:hypothetical protein